MATSVKLRHNVRIVVALLLISIISQLGLSASSTAQSARPATPGITISPPLQQITLGPGLLAAKTNVTVTNNTAHQFSAHIQLVDFKSYDQYGTVLLNNAGSAGQFGLAKWMRLISSDSITLASGQTTTIEAIIDNRADLSPGGHYGAVVVAGDGAPSNAKTNTIGLGQRLASLIFVKKLGGETYGLQLQSLAIFARDTNGTPQSVALQFKSTGNVYVVPRGYIEVTNSHGTVIAKGIINQQSDIVMQGTSRQLKSDIVPIQNTQATGRNTITAYYRYQGQADFNKQSIGYGTPSLLPLYFVGGIVVVVGIVLFSVHSRRRMKKRYS